MRKGVWITFVIIMIITVLAVLVDWPKGPNIKIGSWQKEIKVHEGLDLQGGTHLVYELDLSKTEEKSRDDATQSVINVIDRRVNALGVSEPVIQSAKVGDKRTIIVELPGISNVDEAINVIGKTAQLSFWEQNTTLSQTTNSQIGGWQPTDLTGAHLKKAEVQFDEQTGEPRVGIIFDSEGAKMFANITARNLQKPVAIVLDNEIISAPTVQTAIENGEAVITGQFSVSDAKKLAVELNAGALPVPIQIVEQRTVGPTLGIESVKLSIVAGLIGLLLIAIFMIAYYRFWGLLAVCALAIYTLISLALFKLIPITLTLAGVAGFILSIGMAVDANILIFERMKEELRFQKPINAAIEDGFNRAWSSIRDSNISSLLTCGILYFTTTGVVRGFALTLAIGILVSMFTAITVSRTFLRLALKEKQTK